MRIRIEKDELGEVVMPAEVYYGIHTYRAKENFQISKRPICRQMIKGLATVKKAAAYANYDAGLISKEIRDVIALCCDEILNGRLHGQFVTDLIQGGAGFGMNMNANEVIANRANEMLGHEKGEYYPVHPIDHVNLCQSTNDVIATAGRIAALRLSKKLIVEMKKLRDAYIQKAEEFRDAYTIARTHLIESGPISFGTIFDSLANSIERDIVKLEAANKGLLELPLGGTITGTGFNANVVYRQKVCTYGAKFTSEKFYQSSNMVDTTRHIDAFVWMSSALKLFAINLNKVANDFRLMSTIIGNITIPRVQAGSTNYPGRSIPVILEMVNQVVYYIEGNDLTIARSAESGELELNNTLPIVLACLFESLNFVRRTIATLRSKVVEEIKVNETTINQIQENNMFVAYITSEVGYHRCLEIVNSCDEASIADYVVKEGIMTKEHVDDILDIIHNKSKV